VGELLLRKALRLRERIDDLRRALAGEPDVAAAAAADPRLEAYLAFNLFLAIQDAVDLAAHLVSDRGLAIPATQREVFEALAKAGRLSPDTSGAMGALSSLRNRIAHSYGDLDVARLVTEMPLGLDHLERFLAEVTPSLVQTE